MGRNQTSFHKGQSGNPNGRPPKPRHLTALLEAAGSRTVTAADRKVAQKRLLAELVWQAATTGQAVLPNGETLSFPARDWLDVVKFLYSHIDGPPRQDIDLTSGGEPVIVTLAFDRPDDDGDGE